MVDFRIGMIFGFSLIAMTWVFPASAETSVAAAIEARPMSRQQIFPDGEAERVGIDIIGENLKLIRPMVFWELTFAKQKVRYIRFHFTKIAYVSSRGEIPDFRIRVIQPSSGKVLGLYPASEFLSDSAFSTGFLPDGNIAVQLVSAQRPDGLEFHVDRVSWARPSTDVKLQSTIPNYRFVGASPQDAIERSLAESVARLTIGDENITCTGVLVTPNLVATNFHCLDKSWGYRYPKSVSERGCQDIIVEFDFFVVGMRGISGVCRSVPLARTEKGRQMMRDADIALLEIRPEDIKTNSGMRRPIRINSITPQDKPSMILHYPLGMPLAIQTGCQFLTYSSKEQGVIEHSCDTERGSSGAAMFDTNMDLAAIHFRGAYPDNVSTEQVDNDRREFGIRFNSAKHASLIQTMLEAIAKEPRQ